jgi:CRISPR-associated protein Cas1
LRENGYRCDEAVLYYSATKQRVVLPITDELVSRTITAAEEAWETARRGEIPPPLEDSPKCPRCSLVSICLPDETSICRALRASAEPRQLSLFPEHWETEWPRDAEEILEAEARRLVPARDDLRPLYVIGHGLTIGRSGDTLQVREQGKTVQEVRLREVSQINVMGNVQLTASAIQAALTFERPIAHFSHSGWFYGMTQGIALKNIFLRIRQFAAAQDENFCLAVARQIVTSKIRNQRTLLQRNHRGVDPQTLRLLRNLAQMARLAPSLEELRGIEGTAGRVYFSAFSGMLKPSGDEAAGFAFDFQGRNRRPPRDPVNAMLSFVYAVLVKDLTIVCAAVGFEPYLGFYHQPRFGRPALPLDLMEEFRPLVADSCVITAINTGMVKAKDFTTAGGAVLMKPAARKNLLRAYEQRMDTLVTHPVFDYRVSYRRVLEIQARLLARHVNGEIPTYPGFETR